MMWWCWTETFCVANWWMIFQVSSWFMFFCFSEEICYPNLGSVARIRAASWTGLCRICELSGCGLRLKHFAAVVVMLFLLEKFLTRQLPRQWLLVAAAPNHGRFVPGAGNYGTCRRGNHFFLVVPRFYLYAHHGLILMRVKSVEGSRSAENCLFGATSVRFV